MTAEVLDLSHGLEFVPRADIIGDDDMAVCAGADVVVFTAGAKQKPGQSRLELAEATIGLTKKICRACWMWPRRDLCDGYQSRRYRHLRGAEIQRAAT